MLINNLVLCDFHYFNKCTSTTTLLHIAFGIAVSRGMAISAKFSVSSNVSNVFHTCHTATVYTSFGSLCSKDSNDIEYINVWSKKSTVFVYG